MAAMQFDIRADDLEKLERLTQAQAEAAQAGDLESLRALLEARQHCLDGLRGRRVPPGRLADLSARDAETRALLEARLQGVGRALAHIQTGGQALNAYAAPSLAPAGFMDRMG